MHIEALSIFCDVVRHQSFSRGAMANSVSQSAASQAVRQIEKRLGAQLIDRSKRPWLLTPEGRLFFKGCQEIVERYHELEDSVQCRQHPSGYTVRLASIYSVRLHDLSQYVDRFRTEVPGAEVDLEYMHPDQIYERVLNDQSDLGLISFANPGRELTAIPWHSQPMVIACLPTHRFARPDPAAVGRAGLHPKALAGEDFVTFDRGSVVRRAIDRFLRRREVDVRVVAEFDNIENIKQAVEDGEGIAILPGPTVHREAQQKTLVKVPIRPVEGEPPFVRPLSIIHRRKRRLNPAVTEFIDLLRSGGVTDGGDGGRGNSTTSRSKTRRSDDPVARSRPTAGIVR
jgi:DNA-binding transcriptional LysR family regulator